MNCDVFMQYTRRIWRITNFRISYYWHVVMTILFSNSPCNFVRNIYSWDYIYTERSYDNKISLTQDCYK